MNTLNQCPICGSSQLEDHVMEVEDYLVSHEKFSLSRCGDCGFLFTNPRPEDAELGKYYQSEEYISHSDTSKGLMNKLYLMARRRTLRRKVRVVRDHASGKRLLDIGCGTGAFLNEAKQSGFDVLGLEPEEAARKIADEKYRIEVRHPDALKGLTDDSRDAITLWHVLEHVSDLNEYWGHFSRILSEKGVLIVAVPNPQSPDALHYGPRWAAYDVPRHLWHFRKDDIRALAKKHHFLVDQILPMKLDAYYISMLSEKNTSGKSKILRSFFRGMGFNMAARRQNNYSSLIYVLKKQA